MPHPEKHHSLDILTLLEVAKQVAATGAKVHREYRKTAISYHTKSSDIDLVSEVDLETERVLVAEISQLRPDDGIVSEEGAAKSSQSGVSWVIDPLDGTTNYVYGYPAHALAIGVEIDGQGMVGVVYDTALDKMYAGARGHGAACGDQSLHVTDRAQLELALLATGFLPERTVRHRQGTVLADILPGVRDVRRSGSPALDLCRVAAGQLDGFYEFGLGRWDIVAGAVIAKASGAQVTLLPAQDLPGPLLVASAPGIHETLLELVLQAAKV